MGCVSLYCRPFSVGLPTSDEWLCCLCGWCLFRAWRKAFADVRDILMQRGNVAPIHWGKVQH
jgi:hypothetical protein